MKYRNKKITLDGIEFDSRKEAYRYRELKILERAGEISSLEIQKAFELIPAQYESIPRYGKNGRRLKDETKCIEKAVHYRADFCYTDKNGVKIVEDTKGFKTKDYIIKRKLMLYIHGIKIREV